MSKFGEDDINVLHPSLRTIFLKPEKSLGLDKDKITVDSLRDVFRKNCINLIHHFAQSGKPKLNAKQLILAYHMSRGTVQGTANQIKELIETSPYFDFQPEYMLPILRPVKSNIEYSKKTRGFRFLAVVYSPEEFNMSKLFDWSLTFTFHVEYVLRRHKVTKTYEDFVKLNSELENELLAIPAFPEAQNMDKNTLGLELQYYMGRLHHSLAERGVFSPRLLKFLDIDFERVQSEEEGAFVLALDAPALISNTAWHFIDEKWLDNWRIYVRGRPPRRYYPPGPITNDRIYTEWKVYDDALKAAQRAEAAENHLHESENTFKKSFAARVLRLAKESAKLATGVSVASGHHKHLHELLNSDAAEKEHGEKSKKNAGDSDSDDKHHDSDRDAEDSGSADGSESLTDNDDEDDDDDAPEQNSRSLLMRSPTRRIPPSAAEAKAPDFVESDAKDPRGPVQIKFDKDAADLAPNHKKLPGEASNVSYPPTTSAVASSRKGTMDSGTAQERQQRKQMRALRKLQRKQRKDALKHKTYVELPPKIEVIKDYRVINYNVWRFLQLVHGGGPVISRDMPDLYAKRAFSFLHAVVVIQTRIRIKLARMKLQHLQMRKLSQTYAGKLLLVAEAKQRIEDRALRQLKELRQSRIAKNLDIAATFTQNLWRLKKHYYNEEALEAKQREQATFARVHKLQQDVPVSTISDGLQVVLDRKPVIQLGSTNVYIIRFEDHEGGLPFTLQRLVGTQQAYVVTSSDEGRIFPNSILLSINGLPTNTLTFEEIKQHLFHASIPMRLEFAKPYEVRLLPTLVNLIDMKLHGSGKFAMYAAFKLALIRGIRLIKHNAHGAGLLCTSHRTVLKINERELMYQSHLVKQNTSAAVIMADKLNSIDQEHSYPFDPEKEWVRFSLFDIKFIRDGRESEIIQSRKSSPLHVLTGTSVRPSRCFEIVLEDSVLAFEFPSLVEEGAYLCGQLDAINVAIRNIEEKKDRFERGRKPPLQVVSPSSTDASVIKNNRRQSVNKNRKKKAGASGAGGGGGGGGSGSDSPSRVKWHRSVTRQLSRMQEHVHNLQSHHIIHGDVGDGDEGDDSERDHDVWARTAARGQTSDSHDSDTDRSYGQTPHASSEEEGNTAVRRLRKHKHHKHPTKASGGSAAAAATGGVRAPPFAGGELQHDKDDFLAELYACQRHLVVEKHMVERELLELETLRTYLTALRVRPVVSSSLSSLNTSQREILEEGEEDDALHYQLWDAFVDVIPTAASSKSKNRDKGKDDKDNQSKNKEQEEKKNKLAPTQTPRKASPTREGDNDNNDVDEQDQAMCQKFVRDPSNDAFLYKRIVMTNFKRLVEEIRGTQVFVNKHGLPIRRRQQKTALKRVTQDT